MLPTVQSKGDDPDVVLMLWGFASFITRRFILSLTLLLVLMFFFVFFSVQFSIVITSLGEERAGEYYKNLSWV